MKTKDVPQDDDGFLKEGKIRDLCYAVDENGQYHQIMSLGWRPKNEAMKQAWNDVFEKASETRENVLNGKLSPVAYFMEINMMDIKILSQYSGIPKRKIKKHFKQEVFNKLDRITLEKYSEVFNLTVEQLTDINLIKNHRPEYED